MTAATAEPEKKQILKSGEWVFFYSMCRTNQCPAPAIVCKDANQMNVATLTVFFEGGVCLCRAVMEHDDSRLTGNRELAKNGCWARERIDEK